MARKLILDTHALVWYLEGNSRLSQRVQSLMSAVDSQMVLPLIALAEATLLIERRRIALPSVTALIADIEQDKRIQVYPLTKWIFARSLTKEGQQIPELHDRFIVSTGLHLQDLGHSIAILTRDESITAAGVLPVIW